MELCELKNRSCDTDTKQVSVYKSTIDVGSYLKLTGEKITPCVSLTKSPNPVILNLTSSNDTHGTQVFS